MDPKTIVPESEKIKSFEFKRLGYTLKFIVSADGLACVCSYEPSAMGGDPLKPEELNGFFNEAKIREGVDSKAVKILLSLSEQKKSVSDLVIAKGYPMKKGDDGRIELHSAESETEDEDVDDEQIDFRNVQNFINVKPGDLIGTIIRPENGTPGKTVFGITIPPMHGEPLKPVLGKNVRLDDDGVHIYSEGDGRIFIKGNEISVEDIYVVKGDVDFKIGNINYNGFLEVRGDILDGFSVKAAKGIKVQGNIGACRIESDGDIVFCGMSGQEKGSIYCRSKITANFIHDTLIESLDDILIDTEIRNCDIKTLGAVYVNKGVLVGGSCVAMGGVETATAGSPSSLFTRIVVGVNYNDLEELNKLFNQLKSVLEAFKQSKDRASTEKMIKERALIAEQIQGIRSREYDKANAKVNIKKKLYEKVSLTLEKISEEVREEHSGPLSIITNTVEGGLRFLSMTPLTVKATELEGFFVQEAERMKLAALTE